MSITKDKLQVTKEVNVYFYKDIANIIVEYIFCPMPPLQYNTFDIKKYSYNYTLAKITNLPSKSLIMSRPCYNHGSVFKYEDDCTFQTHWINITKSTGIFHLEPLFSSSLANNTKQNIKISFDNDNDNLQLILLKNVLSQIDSYNLSNKKNIIENMIKQYVSSFAFSTDNSKLAIFRYLKIIKTHNNLDFCEIDLTPILNTIKEYPHVFIHFDDNITTPVYPKTVNDLEKILTPEYCIKMTICVNIIMLRPASNIYGVGLNLSQLDIKKK